MYRSEVKSTKTLRRLSFPLGVVVVATMAGLSGESAARADTILTPTNVTANSSLGGRPATQTINATGLDPTYAANSTVSANPSDPTYIGNWLANSQPSPGLSTDGMWLNNGGSTGIITFDLGSTQTLDGIWVWNYAEHTPSDLSTRGAKAVSVYIASSLNSSAVSGGDTLAQAYTFARMGQGALPGGDTVESYIWAPTFYQFTTPVTAEYIKFNITTNYGDSFTGLSEVRFQAAPPPAHWTGGASTSNWADAGNWSGTVPGAAGGTTNIDTALFNQTVSVSPLTIDTGRNLKNITFDTANVSAMTIGTTGVNPLTLTTGGTIQTTASVANPQIVNAPLVLAGNYTFASGATSSSATLSFGGAITSGAGSGTTTLTLNGSNTGANTIGGNIGDGSSGSNVALTAQGGAWTLGGTNTYTGATAVSAGILQVTGSLGSTSAVSVSGGSLVLSGSGSIGNAATIAVSGAGSLAWSGSGSIGNSTISVTGTGTFAPQAGNGVLAAGSNAVSGSAGATLSLASGTTFSMVDGQVGTFNLQQQAGFGAGTTALTLSGATLNFDLGSSGADQLAVNVGKAVITGTNTIGITTVGSSLTAGGSYPLISAAGGLTGRRHVPPRRGAQTATVVAGPTAYSLALQNSGTVEKVVVSAIPRGGPIVTPTSVAVSGSFSGRPATNTINSSGLNPTFATNANVSSYPADPTYIGNWLENSQPSPGLSTDGMWLSNNTTTGVITFDLGSVQTLAGIWVWNYAEHTSATSDLSNRGAKGVSVYVASSLNSTIPGGGDVLAQAFTLTRTGLGNLPNGATVESYVWAPTYYPFTNPVTGEFIKFNITSNYGDGQFVGLGEVRFQAVPEPSTVALGVLGAMGLALIGRRRRRLS